MAAVAGRRGAETIVVRLLDPGAISGDRLGAWWEQLTQGEKRRLDAFRFERLRHDYLCTRALQRLCLSEVTGVDPRTWRFVATANGRPEVQDPAEWQGLGFNLTHTRGLIACAVAQGGAVGIDAEHRDGAGDVEAIARRFFAPEEAETICAAPVAARRQSFLVHWTVKEACLKALGTGLATPLDAVRLIDVGSPDDVSVAFDPALATDAEEWRVRSLAPTPEHVVALATRGLGDAPLDLAWVSAL